LLQRLAVPMQAKAPILMAMGNYLSEAGRFLNSRRTILRTFNFLSLPNYMQTRKMNTTTL